MELTVPFHVLTLTAVTVIQQKELARDVNRDFVVIDVTWVMRIFQC